jgi:putative N6-adenine-specific DNA methylase
MRANLWLRTASRIIVRVARFKATAFFELEQRAKKIPWRDYIAPGHAVDFRVTAHKSRLYHSDAIAQRLRDACGAVENTGSAGGQLFVVRVVRDEFTISADTSGDLLHMRGYRQDVGKAPLRETLAAALLLAAGWNGTTPLVDPFCGSGTIPIEGALIARQAPPGLARRFAFEQWPAHDAAAWRDLIAAARSAMLATSPVPIRGSDRDRGAIRAAVANAERAGVANDIEFDARAISAVEPPPTAVGLVATNPPYGVRVGDARALRDLYARFGQVMRERFPRWSVAMYTSREDLAAQAALPWTSLFRTSNGGLRIQAFLARGQFLH